ncbi:major facilitator superfamily domain-containing protein [Kickxella alabastrina]|uniref:major facilitator superfamily domain-containing protein n=1 Tax=Kickxella alabastrina TaxID=61397 RepID=UPI002220414B|nr:major facilitator superfamily domain-containing protein [Kickxella alabastrina]KAI7834661.1 major facilitator superfamily domain-containing protein [Kickxella alabastrina]
MRAQEATDKPADGAYAWMVIFACLISLMLSIGINDAYGVYQQHYQLNEFPDETATLISWIGTVQFLVMCFCGIFSGFLCEHFDTRVLNSIGALIMGAALIGGSYCTSIGGLMATQGLLYGLGASFPFVAGTSIPSQWFTRRRGLATGIALAGSGIGGMWMVSATQAMIDTHGRPWAMRVTGGVAMAAVLAVSPWMRVRLVPARTEHIIDWALLRDARFNVFLAAVVFVVAAYFGPFYQMPSYSVVVLHKSQTWGSNMDTLMNGISVVGRLAAGFLADSVGPLNLLIANTVLAVVSLMALWVPFDSVGTLFAVDILFGFAIGGMVSVIPVVAAQVFGLARLPSIIGLLFVGYVAGGLLGVPPMSALLDNVGHRTDYTSSIWYMSVLPLCALVLLVVMRLLITRQWMVKI